MENFHLIVKEQALSRRKSVSIGAETTRWTRWRMKPVSHQMTSPLFSTLPKEIREMIYAYTLTDTGAVYLDKQIPRGERLPRLKAVPCLPTGGAPDKIRYDRKPVEAGASGSALLRTCRLIYTEAISVLYRETQFHFSGYGTLRYFAAITPRARIEEIRSIRIDSHTWWNERQWWWQLHAQALWQLHAEFAVQERGWWDSWNARHWKRLRVVYAAYHTEVPGWKILFDRLLAETEGLENCSLRLLVYDYHHVDPEKQHSPRSYAVVNAGRNLDESSLEWQRLR